MAFSVATLSMSALIKNTLSIMITSHMTDTTVVKNCNKLKYIGIMLVVILLKVMAPFISVDGLYLGCYQGPQSQNFLQIS
jgi:hypothetical protein